MITEYVNPGTIGNLATWKFEDGKVVGLQMYVSGGYAQVRDDLTARTGTKPHEIEVPYHNGFGATWSNQHAEWDNAGRACKPLAEQQSSIEQWAAIPRSGDTRHV